MDSNLKNTLDKSSEKILNRISPQEIEEAKKAISALFEEIFNCDDAAQAEELFNSKFGASKNSILHLAAKFNDADVTNKILDLAAGDQKILDAQNSELYTPLHFAAIVGNVEIVKMLLQAGVANNLPTSAQTRKWVPIHFAAKHGHVETVIALLEAGVDKEVKTGFGLTPLVVAAEFGQVAVFKFLLENGANKDVQTIEDNYHMTALHYAVIGGFTDIVLMLLSSGANRNARITSGYSALDYAAKSDNWQLVSLLLIWGVPKMEDAQKIAKEFQSQRATEEIEKYIAAKKNLFHASWLKDFSSKFIAMLAEFKKENLGEAKIILSPDVSFNAYGILALQHEIGLFKKVPKTLKEFCGENKITDVFQALAKLEVLLKS